MGIIKFNNVPSTTPGLEVETFPNYVAPEKEYQVTHVPGRNGDLVVDTKTYKNVPRSYKVSMAVEPPAVSVSGSTASFEATAERALAECKTAISSDVGKVGTTIINSATDPVENNEPYNFRAVPNGVGDRENDTLIGGTVAWNQHATGSGSVNSCSKSYDAQTNTITITPTNYSSDFVGVYGLSDGAERIANHKIFVSIDIFPDNNGDFKIGYGADITRSATASRWNILSAISSYSSGTLTVYLKSNSSGWSSGTYKIKNVIAVDLTQMFGSTIADYIYGLETATAGAGVAWFRNLFPKNYYAYNAGELISVKTEAHKMVGFNQLDEQYEFGNINSQGVNDGESKNYIRSTNYIRVLPNTTYCFDFSAQEGWLQIYVLQYDVDNSLLSRTAIRAVSSVETSVTLTVLLSKQTHYIRFFLYKVPVYSEDALNTIKTCINLSDASKNGTYEPYEEHIYPLNPALELRGIPKLNSSNKLYYDGDIYSSDGSIIRKYGIVDLGTLSWSYESGEHSRFVAAVSGIKRPVTSLDSSNILCSALMPDLLQNIYLHVNNYAIGVHSSYEQILVYDSDYSDATAFKTAMSGVYLIYELATPVIESASGLIDNVSIASFDDCADDQPVNLLVSEIVAVESGSGIGEKSPTNPYTISGFNSGVVTRCGKNLIENKKFQQTAQAVIIGWDAYTNIGKTYLKAGTYTFSADITTQGTLMCKIGTNSPVSLAPAFSVGHVTATFTIPTNNYCRFYMYASNGFSVNDITNFMIEQGSQATAYEQYNGNTYTFTFGQTVYGGRFDNKGNLVVTHKFLEFDYQSNWRFENILGGNFYVACGSDVKASQFGDDLSCNCSPSSSILAVTTNTCLISVAKNFNFTWGGTLGITNVDDFKTYLQTNNLVIKVKCLLATPITLSITSQDIPTLLGENNIFSNTGNIKTLSYPKQVCPFEQAQEVDDHGTEEYVDNREVAIPVGHESKYFTAGKIYNFSWLDEAGLIKEGELNADTGVLTITNGYKVVDIGDLTWSYNASRVAFNVQITDIKTVSSGTIGNMSCSAYVISAAISSASDAANKPDMTIFQQKDNASVFIKNSSFTDAATFKSAMHGVKLLYELADPVRTIQLTQVQVESLIGHNILISESGNISVTPRTYSTYTEKMNAISDWLHSASGYARLEDTYEPDYYRKAYYDEQTDMENIFNEAGQATLNFICKPQRYLKSGEEPITISSGGLIQNRTRYEAYPILKVTTNNTQGSVAIGNHSITIKAGAGTDPITIDCELQDAWSGTSNKNSYIVLTDGEFPVIDPGTQTVTFDGGVQSVEVIPRWWTV